MSFSISGSANRESAHAKTFGHEAGYVARRTGSGLGHAIGVLVKAFFIFVFTIVAIVLLYLFPGIGLWLPELLYK